MVLMWQRVLYQQSRHQPIFLQTLKSVILKTVLVGDRERVCVHVCVYPVILTYYKTKMTEENNYHYLFVAH